MQSFRIKFTLFFGILVLFTLSCNTKKSTSVSQDTNQGSPNSAPDNSSVITFVIEGGGARLENDKVKVNIPDDTVANSNDGFVRPSEFEGCTDAGTIIAAYDVILNSDGSGDVQINGNYTVGVKIHKDTYSSQDQLAACVWQLNSEGDSVLAKIFFQSSNLKFTDMGTQIEVTIPLTVPNNALFVVDRNGSSYDPPDHDPPGLLDPASISFDSHTQGGFRVTWDRAPDDNGGEVEYAVSLRESADPEENCEGLSSNNIGPQLELEYIFSSLTAGTTYHLRVCTVMGSDRSRGRLAATITIPPDTISLTAGSTTSSSFDMDWVLVSGASHFLVSIREAADPDVGCAGGTSTNTEVNGTTFIESFTALSPSTTYHVRVCSKNASGVSAGRIQTATTSAGGGGGEHVAMLYHDGSDLMLTTTLTGDFEDAGSKVTIESSSTIARGTLMVDSANDHHVCADDTAFIKYYTDSGGTWTQISGSFGTSDNSLRPLISLAGSNTYCYSFDGAELNEGPYNGSFQSETNIDSGVLFPNLSAVFDGSRRFVAYNVTASAVTIRNSDSWSTATIVTMDGNSNICDSVQALGLVVNSSNQAHLIYGCNYSGNGSIVQMTFNGSSWGAPTEVLDLGPSWEIVQGDVAIDKNDDFHIIFNAASLPDTFHYTTDESGSWSSPTIAVAGGVDQVLHIQIAVDQNTDVFVGYTRVKTGDDEVSYVKKPDGGSFSSERVVSVGATVKFFDITAK